MLTLFNIHAIGQKAQIILFDIDFCNIILFPVSRKVNQPMTIDTPIITNPPLHTFMNTMLCVLFFFDQHFYTI